MRTGHPRSSNGALCSVASLRSCTCGSTRISVETAAWAPASSYPLAIISEYADCAARLLPCAWLAWGLDSRDGLVGGACGAGGSVAHRSTSGLDATPGGTATGTGVGIPPARALPAGLPLPGAHESSLAGRSVALVDGREREKSATMPLDASGFAAFPPPPGPRRPPLAASEGGSRRRGGASSSSHWTIASSIRGLRGGRREGEPGGGLG